MSLNKAENDIDKNVLFFFVHPAKYHLFKETIRRLKAKGFEVDICIVKKDVLEELISEEGWSYTNILPNGRKGKIPILSTLFFALKTIFKLHQEISKKKYDLFITDDLLVVNGFLKKIPTLFFQDDDLSAVPESWLWLLFAKKIISPNCCDLGIFNKKKNGYNGNHEWAYLNPTVFQPSFKKIQNYIKHEKYFIVRLVSLTATHDRGKSGINNDKLKIIVELLEKKGQVFICSERKINPIFEKYRVNFPPQLMHHFICFSSLLISDSQTMTSEAAMLGVPSVRFNDFVGRISYLERSEKEFDLTYGFKTNNFQGLLQKVRSLLETKNIKKQWLEKRQLIKKEFIDVNDFILSQVYSSIK